MCCSLGNVEMTGLGLQKRHEADVLMLRMICSGVHRRPFV